MRDFDTNHRWIRKRTSHVLGFAVQPLTDLVSHGLRHAFATLALKSEALDMFELSPAIGHAD